jgi:hypothetical protein
MEIIGAALLGGVVAFYALVSLAGWVATRLSSRRKVGVRGGGIHLGPRG